MAKPWGGGWRGVFQPDGTAPFLWEKEAQGCENLHLPKDVSEMGKSREGWRGASEERKGHVI